MIGVLCLNITARVSTSTNNDGTLPFLPWTNTDRDRITTKMGPIQLNITSLCLLFGTHLLHMMMHDRSGKFRMDICNVLDLAEVCVVLVV